MNLPILASADQNWVHVCGCEEAGNYLCLFTSKCRIVQPQACEAPAELCPYCRWPRVGRSPHPAATSLWLCAGIRCSCSRGRVEPR